MSTPRPCGGVQDRCHPLVDVRRRGLQREVDAERGRALEAPGQEVRGGDEPGAEHPTLDEVAEPERADPQDGDGETRSRRALQTEERQCRVDAVRHGHHLGQHGDLVRESVGDPEQRCSRQEVQVLGPAAEQAWRAGQVEAVPVILEVLAEVVREVVGTVVAATARDVRSRHHSIADPDLGAVAREHLSADRRHGPDVLMTADQRVVEVALVLRAGVLPRFAAEGVLVRAADPGEVDGDDHRTGLGVRHVGLAKRDPAGLLHHGGDGGRHDSAGPLAVRSSLARVSRASWRASAVSSLPPAISVIS